MKKIEHLSSVEEYYQVKGIIGTEYEFLLKNRPRLIYNYIEEYLKNDELLVNELNERYGRGKFLGYEKNCAISVIQELRNGEHKEMAGAIESILVELFKTFDDFISSYKIEKPKAREVEKYAVYENEIIDEQLNELSEEEIEAKSMEYYENLLQWDI
ncbi:hypothetical protein [Clostridium sp.]|uniref:hypothetical protein n=1 Tax=Clostridium sp. TaxID=1506 RepID=UPI00290DDA3B|nr:hypothetical protein [Clostridium sp.]MDU4589927.1 hypothetical protein [Clostridium sp.]